MASKKILKKTIAEKLAIACKDLVMISETEAPFAVIQFNDDLTGDLTIERLLEVTKKPKDSKVEIVELDDFFCNAVTEEEWHNREEIEMVQRFQSLVQTLKTNLTDIQVFRVESDLDAEIHVYILGRTAERKLSGLSTKVVET
jgi:hypothetical protein